ncbi:50S ribosomal protein L21 [Jannaschia donghaensis]|uniref:Large ribosomal subunit protein bL21 n=1 Tax=Jannaschia donghaensis TaxID=420998 RepID=A0A0M6YK17_9RHOB|nr:50S ribosomal protein L21 [Jannaschia donghaensis]CTQ50701.1 50S ribosomal protein L21 [Jannaschia donghaensis]
MFAVLKTGGKQYRVAEGDVLRVERLAAEAGETIQFNDVMMLGGDNVTVGAPLIDGAAVQADVIDQIKGEKLIHFVKRRRKHSSKRTKGHRQRLTLLRITSILASGGDKSGVKEAKGAGSMTVAERAAASPASNKSKVRSGNKGTSGMSTAAKVAVAAGAAAATGAVVAAGVAASKSDKPAKAAKAVKKTVEDAVAPGSKPGNLLDEARGGKADDLKKISGVGPKLEGVLHENGVFHFDQISAWGPDEIAYMDDRLSFKGRIERDGWIDQATKFAAEQE